MGMVFTVKGVFSRGIVGLFAFVLVGGLVLEMGVVGPVAASASVARVGDGDGVLQVVGEGFSDIADAGGHRGNVETLAEMGVLEGTECAPGQFCPKDPVQRWVMAVWLVRAVDETEPTAVEATRFVDVDAEKWWVPYVERLAGLGITRGCAVEPVRFCPTEPVTRQQMASFLVRAFQLDPVPGNKFIDVEEGNSHLADINALSASGITAGCAVEPARYCPLVDTTRAEMATFLARALGIATRPSPETDTVPKGDFTAIAAGAYHTCGLKVDGKLVCWGENPWGQADPPEGEFTAIAGGDRHSCGVRSDETISCWGDNRYGQADGPDGQFSSVAAGSAHSCGLRTDGTLSCWGSNQDGETNQPQGDFGAISVGIHHSCGLRSDGNVVCWGRNDGGQTDAPADKFTSISAGGFHSCGVRANGAAVCWGFNDLGQSGSPAAAGRFMAVAAGRAHSCGVHADQTVTCWGSNTYGQAHPPQGAFHTVAAGERHTCGLRTDQTVICWGAYEGVQADPPVQETMSIAVGRNHACGILADKTLTCWGLNDSGAANPPGGEYVAVAAGRSHSCAIRTDRTIDCWGNNGYEQASAPEGEFAAVAAVGWHSCGLRVDHTITCWGFKGDGRADPPLGAFTAIAVGDAHSCGIRTDDTIVCWGSNYVGATDSPPGAFTSIDAGNNHSCGIRSDQSVVCWGYNGDGQTDPPEGAFIAVSAGQDHSCGIRADQTITCWGLDQDGRSDLPDGEFTAVSAGVSFSCGLRTDGSVNCWDRAVIVPAPEEVNGFVPFDVKMCRPKGINDHTAGFPLPSDAAPSLGTLRVAVLFVDFPDAQATHTTYQEAELGLSTVERYFGTFSYGKLDLQFAPLHRWLRAEQNYAHYTEGRSHITRSINAEAIRLADAEYDFTDYHAVMIVMPSTHFIGGEASGHAKTDEGSLPSTRINAFPFQEPREPADWGFIGAHELMHNLGLPDLYTSNRLPPLDAPAGKAWFWTTFDIMRMWTYFPIAEDDPRLSFVHRTEWSTYLMFADEMLAWSRWQLGWLGAKQIRCLNDLEQKPP